MTPYPPGTSSTDSRAPWNDPDPPECRECGNLIADANDHAPDCVNDHMDAAEVADLQENEVSRRTWDAVKEDPTPSEQERYGLDDPTEDA
jgi:hypothetical protein